MDFESSGQESMTPTGYADTKLCRMPSIKQRIELAVTQAEERLRAVKRAEEIFRKNPELEELLNIMQNTHF